jgi:IS66 Orf2 like protein
MLPQLSAAVRVFLCTRPTDLRKGFDGLSGLVQECFSQDLLTGHLFLFLNRRRDRIKILYFDRDGLAIWYKKQASDCTRPRPFTGNLGHTDNLAGRPLTAGGMGSHQESSRARRRPMSRNDSVLAPPRARRTSSRRRSIISGVC